MSTIEQTLNAGVPVTFPGGEQFHLLEADEPVDVTFFDNRNRLIEKWDGMKGGFRHTIEEGFIQVRVESATGQTVKIALTSGRGQYDRSQGDVTVLNMVKDNSWYYDSNQEKCFMGGVTKSSLANNYSIIQILNPASSGKIVLINRIQGIIGASATVQVWLKAHHTALTSNSGFIRNKLIDGAAQVATQHHQHSTSALGTSPVVYLAHLDTNNKVFDCKFKDPIVLNQGKGIVLSPSSKGIELNVTFFWTEIPA